MTPYSNLIIIITLIAIISYINHRFIRMQSTIAIMATALILSLVLILFDRMGLHVIHTDVTRFVDRLHFQQLLMNCMLGLLLFAGALTIDIPNIKNQKWEIMMLASFGVILSSLIVGFGCYYLLPLVHVQLPLIACLLFGSLISPTDPIAILGIFKHSDAPKKLSTLVAAESLFNDGIAVVLFLSFYNVAFSGKILSVSSVGVIFLQETLGGLGFGLLLGILAYLLMEPIDDQKIETLVTIALVSGGYALAQAIGVSGPLAMVAAGIFIANNKSRIFRSQATQAYLETFWELVDELLNAILFLLTGAEVLLVQFSWGLLAAAFSAIPLVLFARYVTVAISMSFFKWRRKYPSHTVRIMTWGGLRGGLAVALALALPSGQNQTILVTMTYTVVLFSILVQGTTVKRLINMGRRRWLFF